MLAANLLEEAGSSSGSIWIPVLILGWFLLMTIVGWQVSRRNAAVRSSSQDTDTLHSENNPSEFDNH